MEELLAKQEELQQELAEELEKETSAIICQHCGKRKEGKHWINKQDQNTFCSESCYDAYYTTEKCDECGVKITGKSYYNDYENKTGTLCQDCCEKRTLADLKKKQTPSSSSPSNSPNQPPLNDAPPQQSKNDLKEDDDDDTNEENKPGLPDSKPVAAKNNPPPKPNLGDKYASACSDCKNKWSHSYKMPTHCPSCQSKNIKVYDAHGALQAAVSTEKEPSYYQIAFRIIAIIVICCLIIHRTFRWKKAKKMGKKYNWWTNKIS